MEIPAYSSTVGIRYDHSAMVIDSKRSAHHDSRDLCGYPFPVNPRGTASGVIGVLGPRLGHHRLTYSQLLVQIHAEGAGKQSNNRIAVDSIGVIQCLLDVRS